MIQQTTGLSVVILYSSYMLFFLVIFLECGHSRVAECCAQPGQTGLFTQSCCDLVVPWPHTGVSFQVLLPAGGIM